MIRNILLAAVLLLATAAPAAAQTGPTYNVYRGDTWTSVARRYNVGICALAAANGHSRCSSIYRASAGLMAGQTLDIPR